MFTASLFPVAKIWNQPKSPLTDEWTRKRWHIYMMDYYSAIKMKSCPLQPHVILDDSAKTPDIDRQVLPEFTRVELSSQSRGRRL